ncbi:MAG: hypothetical protein ACT4SY_06700 [Hyphomicrobiales bacterium]
MSTSESLNFEAWLKSAYRETGDFTVLIVLVQIGEGTVTPVSSTYVHVIGDELSWPEFSGLMAKSGCKWDGVAIFPETGAGGGPIPDMLAKVRLRDVEARVGDDRIHINDGHFFDIWGRRMKVEEAVPAAVTTRQ